MAFVCGGLNFYPLVLTMLFALCTGFVLISSAAGLNGYLNTFNPGEKLVFDWKSSVIINDVERTGKNVGFRLQGEVLVTTVWSSADRRLLKLELNNPQLLPVNQPNGKLFKVGSEGNEPVIVVVDDGSVEKFYFSKHDSEFVINIKKGIVSLLQVKPDNQVEMDTSGYCNVTYISENSKINKIKTTCQQDDLNNFQHRDPILGVTVTSTRVTEYTTSEHLLKSVRQIENHLVSSQSKLELGSLIESEQFLTYQKTVTDQINQFGSFEEVLAALTSGKEESKLLSSIKSTKSENKLFSKEIGAMRDSLKTSNLGTVKSAKAFVPIFNAAKSSNVEEISKALGSKKNEKILPQLYDILGYVQTLNSHAAAMKHLHLDQEEHTDLIERYLWALSFSIHPQPEILEDLLEKYRKYVKIPENIKTTLILSMASMARTLSKLEKQNYDTLKLLKTVEETIVNGFDYAKNKERYIFLNALKNLQSPSTIPKLLQIIQTGTVKEEILAWKAVKSFGPNFWSLDLLKQAEQTLLQLDRVHDSSSRTLAVDILLGAGASDLTVETILNFVASNSTYEVRQYAFQSIKMLAEQCEKFNQRVTSIIRRNPRLNNYSTLSPRGLSTALARNIFRGSSVNGSLVSVQEIKSGIVKRGVVDVVLTKEGISKELFTLGIFAGGLSSFVSSEDEGEEEESATAGMELTVLGTQIRPFVFFDGQGELMGHVWSGTASDMTPAFQALILTQDHQESIRLGNGLIVDVDVIGVVSFDLSGKIEVSIWSRTSQSLIKKSVGFVSNGLVKINTPVISSQVEFEGSIEPALNLEIDGDFSDKVKLCMRLSQPDSLFRHEIRRLESVQAKKLIDVTNKKRRQLSGYTYALNRKNNEMCSALFS